MESKITDKTRLLIVNSPANPSGSVMTKEELLEVGKIAETESHHPDIHFGWGYAQVIIFTHAIKGLAESDFILASKIDQIKINER